MSERLSAKIAADEAVFDRWCDQQSRATHQKQYYRLLAEIERLRGLIGDVPPGAHKDEWQPRGATWHGERANWIAEVERLRAALQKAFAVGLAPRDVSGARTWAEASAALLGTTPDPEPHVPQEVDLHITGLTPPAEV